ncbi:hypothetical protein GXB84_08130 [Stenotrophomonas acidaminiphila]|uniref:hypothetical protein n=1 Tax=Stenotrophomonas acidaminiphila TaxID=128780 RepID=UPI0013760D0E|nr:hypothetical protein [Stenotrophomonas acidaminiphila]NCT87293.1 hypothetical protein [Stenotrophomonas acidaminiphila]
MQRTVAVGPSPVQIAYPRARGMRQGFAVVGPPGLELSKYQIDLSNFSNFDISI